MNNILTTCCNIEYFEACLTLISSIYKFSKYIVDRILVYNLGLSRNGWR